jgi:hypothetical protein
MLKIVRYQRKQAKLQSLHDIRLNRDNLNNMRPEDNKLVDSHNILNSWKNLLSQLLNVRRVNVGR